MLNQRIKKIAKFLTVKCVDTASLSVSISTVSIPVTPIAPAIPAEQLEEFYKKNEKLLADLDIPKGSYVRSNKYELSFVENTLRYRKSQDEYILSPFGNERISFYEFGEDSTEPCVWFIFCHGGKISPDVIGSSAYLPIVSCAIPSVKIVGINHRGTTSKPDMGCYSLSDRITDVYVILYYLLQTKRVKQNDIIVGFGDSMGGHVISTATKAVDIFDALILTEPAAYTEKAQNLFFKDLSEFFPTFPKASQTFTDTIRNNPPIDSIALNCVESFSEKNKDILLAYVEEDEKLNASNFYTPHLYWDAISKTKCDSSNVLRRKACYSGIHGDTTQLEIQAIREFIDHLQKKYAIKL